MIAASSNATLLPEANIVFGGSGANRTATLTPAANEIGTTTVTITVSDGTDTASASFVLTVQPAVVPSYTLTIGVVGEGSVMLDPAGGTYTAGMEVALILVPAVGWEFDGWSNDLTGSDDPAAITMDANKVVTATFVEKSQPTSDMSNSLKSVNLVNVMGGDYLTYTIRLFNSSDVTATASLTDPIPSGATYITGSVRASSGSASFGAGQVSWSGDVISGTPIIIQFAVMVDSGLDVGTIIENTAYLNDGADNILELVARSIFNPGFWLSINDGALYTNQDVVTLTHSYAAGNGIGQVQFSNDGGFGAGSSGWENIDPGNLVLTGWELDVYGNLIIPRTVYARFRDSDSGLIYGPIQDDIIYDPTAPTVSSIEILTQATRSNVMGDVAQDAVTLRVTTGDDNSGVDKIVVSHDDVCDANDTEIDVTQATQDFDWTLQDSGEVYVCAVDRAGNTSPAKFKQGEAKYTILLPLVVRNG